MDRFVVISGCSGGGKSTVLAELAGRGHAIVLEPGRRIVEDELGRGGTALPWVDLDAFLRRAVAVALEDRKAAAQQAGWVFFDRGLVDAVAGLQRLHGQSEFGGLLQSERYHSRMFFTPPWPEIYVNDAERQHGLAAAIAEYEHLSAVYPALGYELTLLPKTDVAARADFVLAMLSG